MHAAPQVTVIVKHMFTLDEVLGDPLFAEELEKDVQREAGKTGRVEKVCRDCTGGAKLGSSVRAGVLPSASFLPAGV